MPGPQKACPVVLRKAAAGLYDILAFRHPLAGTQLVKGAIEHGETPQQAAIRELFEEAGLTASAIAVLGSVQMSEPKQEWHFVLCEAGRQAETWTHWTSDGGGLEFSFFWHPLDREPDATWQPIFRRALSFIRQQMKSGIIRHDPIKRR